MPRTPVQEELSLLRTYAAGPRIWDAAAVFPVVLRLEDKGLIEPAALGYAYQLTDAGREMLRDNPAGP